MLYGILIILIIVGRTSIYIYVCVCACVCISMELLSFITHVPIFLLSFATKSRTRQHIFTSYHRFKLANSTLSPTLFFHSAVERIGAHRRQVPKPVPRAITISR